MTWWRNADKALPKIIWTSQKPCDLVQNWPRYSLFSVEATFVTWVVNRLRLRLVSKWLQQRLECISASSYPIDMILLAFWQEKVRAIYSHSCQIMWPAECGAVAASPSFPLLLSWLIDRFEADQRVLYLVWKSILIPLRRYHTLDSWIRTGVIIKQTTV